jgi:hypothetical protein
MVEGVIGRINEKQWKPGKFFYSFTLRGQDGWYTTGTKRPPEEGVSVRFEYKTNAKGYKDVDGSIEIRTDGPVESTPSVNKFQKLVERGGSSTGASGAYWDRKEARDVHNDELREVGASRNTAISIIDLMIKHEVVKLPAPAKREEFIWTLIDRYTDKLRGKGQAEEASEKQDALPSARVETDAHTDEWN